MAISVSVTWLMSCDCEKAFNPVPTVVSSSQIHFSLQMLDYGFVVTAIIRNDDAAENILTTVTLMQGTETWVKQKIDHFEKKGTKPTRISFLEPAILGGEVIHHVDAKAFKPKKR